MKCKKRIYSVKLFVNNYKNSEKKILKKNKRKKQKLKWT